MPVTVVQRRASLQVFVAGTAIGHIKSATWTGSFTQPFNEAKVDVTQLPGGFDNDQSLQIVAGNGVNHVTRFIGLCRSPIYNLDGTITIQGVSQLAKAYEYENSEDPRQIGGLAIFDIIGTNSCTDQAMVSAILSKVGVGSIGTIGGTGIVFGAQVIDPAGSGDAFIWSSGDHPNQAYIIPGVGERATDYIAKWDRVSAVHPGPFGAANLFESNSTGAVTAPVGFYRTFETLGGVINRTLIGGRPRGTTTIATPFTEGVDIRVGSITRGYPVGNRFAAIGYSWSSNLGPEHYAVQSSNPYMSGSRRVTCPIVSSPMIEKSAELIAGPGMSCEKVARALEPDLNRIIVSGTIATGRDDYISHGATILVQGPGGAPGRLGTGENVWVQSVRGQVNASGFVQELEILGGGVPDNFLPPVPQ